MRSGRKVWKIGEMASGRKRNPDSHQNLIITFWPIYNVPWNLYANLFRGICIKSTN